MKVVNEAGASEFDLKSYSFGLAPAASPRPWLSTDSLALHERKATSNSTEQKREEVADFLRNYVFLVTYGVITRFAIGYTSSATSMGLVLRQPTFLALDCTVPTKTHDHGEYFEAESLSWI